MNRVHIDRGALRSNFALCRQAAKGAKVLAMVKADAYGHGMIECAGVLSGCGADAFGVAEAIEGVLLRRAGFREPVLVMAGVLPETVEAVLEHDLTPVLPDGSSLEALSRLSGKLGRTTDIHVKVDAGMGRLGLLPDEVGAVIDRIGRLPHLRLAGILAHFPSADADGDPSTSLTLDTFRRTVAELENRVSPGVRKYIANSAGLLYVPGAVMDTVRPGIALYGYYPDGGTGERASLAQRLQPVMSFTSRVLQVRQVPAGHGLGYGHLFTTRRPTTLAVLPAGYEDGYLRCVSNRAEVLLHGRRAPVVGRVSMNLTLVDVTDIPGVQAGDEAVLLGRQGAARITADEVAGWMETISYEVLCLFGKLNDRYYFN